MPEFDLDTIKKTWQEQEVLPKYRDSEISEMLNKKSRNYVKYIFWISAAEFLLFLGISISYIAKNEDTNSFLNIMTRLGIRKTEELESDFSQLYFVLKILSLVVTLFFVIRFYLSYRKIHVEASMKKFILQIISFRKTVNLFIFTNIFLLVVFTAALTFFILKTMSDQKVQMDHPTFIGFITGLMITTLLTGVLIWIYYRVVYGIINKRLGRNLKQLKDIEQNNETNGELYL